MNYLLLKKKKKLNDEFKTWNYLFLYETFSIKISRFFISFAIIFLKQFLYYVNFTSSFVSLH